MLAGCGVAQQAHRKAEADRLASQVEAATAKCVAEHGKPPTKPTVPYYRCRNQAQIAAMKEADRIDGTSHAAQISLAHAQILVAAERYDLGKITAIELEAEIARASVSAQTAVSQADRDAAMIAAQQQQAAAASSQAAMARQKAIGDAFRGPQRTTCNTFGGTSTCY